MLPGTLVYVYLGSAVRSLRDVASGNFQGGMGQKILFGVGLVATVAVTTLITRLARRALDETLPPPAANCTEPVSLEGRANA